MSNDPSISHQSGGYSLERNTSREPAHLTSSRGMLIKPILAEEISENPCCSGNREGLGVFAPIRMIVGIREKQRYPHEYPKDHEHHCQKASREKCHSIRKKSHSRKCEQNSRRYRPKHLSWRNPLRDKFGGSVKIKRLFEGKGSGTDAQKNAADAMKPYP